MTAVLRRKGGDSGKNTAGGAADADADAVAAAERAMQELLVCRAVVPLTAAGCRCQYNIVASRHMHSCQHMASWL